MHSLSATLLFSVVAACFDAVPLFVAGGSKFTDRSNSGCPRLSLGYCTEPSFERRRAGLQPPAHWMTAWRQQRRLLSAFWPQMLLLLRLQPLMMRREEDGKWRKQMASVNSDQKKSYLPSRRVASATGVRSEIPRCEQCTRSPDAMCCTTPIIGRG